MVNVMGDALATGIMAHICRKDFIKEGDGVSHLPSSDFPLPPVFLLDFLPRFSLSSFGLFPILLHPLPTSAS